MAKREIRNTLQISLYPNGSFSEDTMTYVAKEKKKNRRRYVSTSASKPANFEPDATKIPEYYENVCLEEIKCRELSIRE